MRWAVTLTRRTLPFVLAPAMLWAQQYTADKAGPVPAELAPAIAQALEKPGFQIKKDGSAYCSIWLRSHLPSGPRSQEQNGALPNVTLPNIVPGALLGVIRFDAPGSDRRGVSIQPGVYTLRYEIMPMNDDHQGAAPQRDFLLLSPAAEDRDLNAAPNFDALVALSRQVSRTAHPAVLSIRKAGGDSAGFSQQGDSDWVLEAPVGDTMIAIVLAGTAGN